MDTFDLLRSPHLRDSLSPKPVGVALCLTLAVGGCSAVDVRKTAPETPPVSDAVSYSSIDLQLGERLYPNEVLIADKISTVIETSIREQYSPGSARRDAHPKAHGCVRAKVSDSTRADTKRDARGIAVKVLGVPASKLLQDEEQATTQDFIMINHPVFFATDPARYLSFMEDVNSGKVYRKVLIPIALGFKGTVIALETRNSRISNPLQTRYWSMVPYQLGTGPARQAVKYSVRACSAATDTLPKSPGHDYLHDALRASLQKGDACMEFLVQPRTSTSMDIEDSRIEWKESQAPFYPVAMIRIPRQVFDTPEQNEFCENLSFTPWHALPEHKPLGVTNRLRKVIYDRVSRVRHEMNETKRQEPQ